MASVTRDEWRERIAAAWGTGVCAFVLAGNAAEEGRISRWIILRGEVQTLPPKARAVYTRCVARNLAAR
jgi:hypothetical protein